jgi:biotin transporter BioY
MAKIFLSRDSGGVRPRTALDDTGTVHAFVLLGWIPPAIAAVVGGLIVAFATGDALAFVRATLVGTIAGYTMSLLLLVLVMSWFAEKVSERVANGLLVSVVVGSTATALAVVLIASGFGFNLVLDDSTTQTMNIALGLFVIGLMAIGLIALAVSVVRRVARRLRRMLGSS